jgi:Zn-dependent protease
MTIGGTVGDEGAGGDSGVDGIALDDAFVRAGVHEPSARTRAAIAQFGDEPSSWRHTGPRATGVAPASDRTDAALFRVSPIFLAILGLTAASAWWLWSGHAGRLGVFVFIVLGWVVSLCLHEFGHALVGYHGGDHSVANKGYLRLDPRRYQHTVLSFILPVVFLLIGGIGLPGGAVWIDRAAIRQRRTRSAMSLAGPLANAICALLCLLPFSIGVMDVNPESKHFGFTAALGFLGVVQISALFLNLLPVPGLDGWGALEPWLPASAVQFGRRVGGFGALIVFLLLFQVPAVSKAFWHAVYVTAYALHLPFGVATLGYRAMTFWLH